MEPYLSCVELPQHKEEVEALLKPYNTAIFRRYDDKQRINSSYSIFVKDNPDCDYSKMPDLDTEHWVMLNNFPGNCGSLILAGIQPWFSIDDHAHFDRFVGSAIVLADACKYSSIFVSCTDNAMVKYLVKTYKFEVILDKLLNPHSENLNTFLVKKL